MSDSGVTIARAAEAACVGVETVRYYERRVLVAQPAQRPGSYRRYDRNHVARIRFIKRAQGLGFSLQEIQGLLALQDGTDRAKVRQIALARLSAIRTRLEDLRRRRMTIYVGIQPGKLAESRLIVNLFFSQLINVNTRVLPQNDPSLRHQCLLLMDEFTSIGRVDILSRAVAYMAGYNLRLLPIIQSMAQLDAVYGKELSRTILTNHALQIVYAPREQQDANDYSEMLGYRTIKRRARTRSHGGARSVSDNEVLERRALMLPQELKAMGPEKQILLYEGLAHPVLCRKIRYYNERYFTRRLLPRVEVPPLAVDASGPAAAGAPRAYAPAADARLARA